MFLADDFFTVMCLYIRMSELIIHADSGWMDDMDLDSYEKVVESDNHSTAEDDHHMAAAAATEAAPLVDSGFLVRKMSSIRLIHGQRMLQLACFQSLTTN